MPVLKFSKTQMKLKVERKTPKKEEQKTIDSSNAGLTFDFDLR